MTSMRDNSPLSRIEQRLENIELRMSTVPTRSDMESLRKELVARESLDLKLNVLNLQISQLVNDREKDKKDFIARLERMENEQETRSDKLWMKVGPAIAALAFLLSFFEFISHISFK